jgi:hypothetical protein
VNDPLTMSVIESFGHVGRKRSGGSGAGTTSGQKLCQAHPLHELGHEIDGFAIAADVVDRHDSRVTQPGHGSALEPLLRDPDGSVSNEAARALGAWAMAENVPALIDALDSGSGDLRHASMDALSRLGDKRAAPYIARRLIDGGDRSHATHALQALGPLAETDTVPYLRHDNSAVRVAACRVLQIAGTRKSVQALQITTNDRNRDVARAALDALDGIARRRTTKTGTSGR